MCNVSAPQPHRIDFVIDTYSKVSIKRSERERCSHGKGIRVQITSGTQKAPYDWSSYLADEHHKQELPEFLFTEWSANKDKVYATILKKTKLLLTHGTKCHELKLNEWSGDLSVTGNQTTSMSSRGS